MLIGTNFAAAQGIGEPIEDENFVAENTQLILLVVPATNNIHQLRKSLISAMRKEGVDPAKYDIEELFDLEAIVATKPVDRPKGIGPYLGVYVPPCTAPTTPTVAGQVTFGPFQVSIGLSSGVVTNYRSCNSFYCNFFAFTAPLTGTNKAFTHTVQATSWIWVAGACA